MTEKEEFFTTLETHNEGQNTAIIYLMKRKWNIMGQTVNQFVINDLQQSILLW